MTVGRVLVHGAAVLLGGAAAASVPGTARAATPTPRPTAAAAASLSLVKTATDASGDGKASLDEHLTFTFRVTNTGSAPVTGLRIVDAKLRAAGVTISCPTTSLAPGAVTTCTSQEYSTSQGDVDSGSVTNTATAQAISDTGESVSSPSAASVTPASTPARPPAASAVLIKSARLHDLDGDGLADPGESITYSFRVINTGFVTLTDVLVRDSKLGRGAVTCAATTLAPGTTTTCSAADYRVTAADVTGPRVINEAFLTATTPTGLTMMDGPRFADVAADQGGAAARGRLSLTKTARLRDLDGDGRAEQGESVRYTFRVTNTGGLPVSRIRIRDRLLAGAGVAISCPRTSLDPGATMRCTSGPYAVTAADERARRIRNTAVAQGVAGGVRVVSRGASAAVRAGSVGARHDVPEASRRVSAEAAATPTRRATSTIESTPAPALAATGADVAAPVGAGAAAILAGVALLGITRGRRRRPNPVRPTDDQ